MKRRSFLSAWQCDSDQDYHAQFEQQDENEIDPDDSDNFVPCDDDCNYWKSNCYGRG